jgi:hypothetical protein
MEMNMNNLINKMKEYWWVILVLLLLFAPSWCNGVPHYTGIRGCSTGNTPGQNKMFFNLITF